MYCATSKSRTSPAKRVGNAEASKRLMAEMPERPATRFAQALGTSLPTGLTMPSPVMTTRRRLTWMLLACEGERRLAPAGLPLRGRASALRVRLHVVDGLLHRGDLLGFLVRDLGL